MDVNKELGSTAPACETQTPPHIKKTPSSALINYSKLTWQQVNSDDSASFRSSYALCCNERPSTWRGTQVHHNLPLAEKPKSECKEV
jgi:hypothetical protein